MSVLKNTLCKIDKINEKAKKASRERIDVLLKPVGSLGVLENVAEQLSGITGETIPTVDKKAILCFAADHGVCDEGVSAAPQVFTEIMTPMIAAYKTGVGVFARQCGADVFVYDVGMIPDLPKDCTAVDKKIRRGTANMRKEPAMTQDEAIKAIEVGIEAAEKAISEGYNVLGTGEMGIGNTTPSTAIFAVLGDVDPEEITGVGANLSEDLTQNKAQVIRDAIALNKPDMNDGVDILAKVGGLEIGAMAGVMLAGAAHHVPVLIDGYISTAAAAIAIALKKEVKDYLICSHASDEKGAKFGSDLLGFKPFLLMDMRLGEGSGAALAFNIIDAAVAMTRDMATYGDVNMGVV
ncbi:MAG: nicotinate-nucleotide--dimethylbenzimidazole phosphoribosyltransferase [Eubacterium sp.]